MNKTKNLLVINQFASLPKYSFGAGERFYFLSKNLHRSGFNISVVSGAFNHLFKDYPKVSGLFTTEQTPDADFIWVKLKKYKPQNYVWRTLCWFEFTFKLFFLPIKRIKPDVVIVSSMSLPPIVYAIWLKWRYKAKFILEIRDIWPMTAIEIGGYSKYNPLIFFLGLIEQLGYRNANHIVSVLPGFNKHLQEMGFGAKPFTWIPNGIFDGDSENEASGDPLILLPTDKFNIVYAGTIGNANAMEYLIMAAEILKNDNYIQINIIGDGPLKADIENEASNLTNVNFIPKVLKKDLQSIIVQADVCYIGWHGRNIYNYGVSANKYNDYMLAKKAILSSSNISDDPVLMAECGLNVPADDSVAIANGILQLKNMPKKFLINMGINGYNFIKKNQVYDVIAKKYLLTLEKVLNE